MTETWLRSDAHVNQLIEDFENRDGYAFIRRDRGEGKRGGGVAVCFDKSRIAMSRIRLPHSKYEIVGAIGRRTGQRRKVAALVVYLPPSMKAEQVKRCLKDVNDAIVHVKQKYCDPYIFVGGDFNKKDIRVALADHTDVKTVLTGPTRGGNTLDIIATNCNENLTESGTTEPIKSESEVPSDHLTVFVSFKMKRIPEYIIEQYEYYHHTKQGDVKFGEWIGRQDWRDIYREPNINKKVDILHDIFNEGMAESYEWKSRKKKSSEPAWMTDGIRDMIKKRRKLFKRLKRRGTGKF